MTDWSSVGENPAPGDPGAVLARATTFSDVAHKAGVCADELRRLKDGAFGWRGQAADEFRADMQGHLPGDLDHVQDSYDLATNALRSYGNVLSMLQSQAYTALSRANTSIDDEAAADARLARCRDAQSAVERALAVARTNTQTVRQALRTPAYYTPGNESQLLQLNSQYVQSQVEEGRSESAAADARRASAREEASRADAHARLQAARAEVRQLRAERDEAVDAALSTLKEARQHAVHESWWGKIDEWAEKTFTARTLAALTHVIDAVGSFLQDAALVFAAVGIVFPPAVIIAAGLITISTVATLTAGAICLVRVANARTPIEREMAVHDLEREGMSLAEGELTAGAGKLMHTKLATTAIREVGSTPFARDLSAGTLKLVRAPMPRLMSSGLGRRVIEIGEPLVPSGILTRTERATIHTTRWPTIGDDKVRFPFLGTRTAPPVPERIAKVWDAGGDVVKDRASDHLANGLDDLRERYGLAPRSTIIQTNGAR
jgi:hypothetical protein